MPQFSRAKPDDVIRGAPSRSERVGTWVGLTMVLMGFTWPILMLTLRAPGVSALLLYAPVVSLLVGGATVGAIARYRSRKRIERAAYRICLRCRYDLTASPPAGACPECGAAYHPDLLRRSWRWTYAATDGGLVADSVAD